METALKKRSMAAIEELADIFGPYALTDEFGEFLQDTLWELIAGKVALAPVREGRVN